MPEISKPRALRPGDTIGIVAPGSPVRREALLAGVAELERLGYRTRLREDIFDADAYFAGSHQRRADEFIEMMDDPSVAAIFCARGGYGCNYVAGRLAGRAQPEAKIVMGYSDVTTLLALFWQRERWVTFHGPMVAVDFAGGACDLRALTMAGEWEAGQAQVLSSGRAEGVLLGGCISLLVTSLGTPREIDWSGAIVFLEDVNEERYRLDRLLSHLREAGKFREARGIVFGEMKGCPDAADTILRALEGLKIPMALGLRSGHTSGGNVCLPFGVQARLEDGRLTILEGAVR